MNLLKTENRAKLPSNEGGAGTADHTVATKDADITRKRSRKNTKTGGGGTRGTGGPGIPEGLAEPEIGREGEEGGRYRSNIFLKLRFMGPALNLPHYTVEGRVLYFGIIEMVYAD